MARISNKYQARNKFYILTNGEQTEKNYFELLKSKHLQLILILSS